MNTTSIGKQSYDRIRMSQNDVVHDTPKNWRNFELVCHWLAKKDCMNIVLITISNRIWDLAVILIPSKPVFTARMNSILGSTRTQNQREPLVFFNSINIWRRSSIICLSLKTRLKKKLGDRGYISVGATFEILRKMSLEDLGDMHDTRSDAMIMLRLPLNAVRGNPVR